MISTTKLLSNTMQFATLISLALLGAASLATPIDFSQGTTPALDTAVLHTRVPQEFDSSCPAISPFNKLDYRYISQGIGFSPSFRQGCKDLAKAMKSDKRMSISPPLKIRVKPMAPLLLSLGLRRGLAQDMSNTGVNGVACE